MQSLVDYESSEEEEESSEPIGTMPALPSFFAPGKKKKKAVASAPDQRRKVRVLSLLT